MASIIEGYNYDIFISYRQKDNKGDRWVTEFVEQLNGELEATFKEDISIYFDENPHDGLLETHNVDKSLEDKLKCLIFIPIISQTYCDPKSFAWQHEFCAFNKLAKEDKFSRDIKLASGNVASRILPVKIHDLDPEDTKLLENELGEVLRGIEFIHRASGVNRPLTSQDDQIRESGKVFYRDQINKVANAVKEIINAIKHYNPQTGKVKQKVTAEVFIPQKNKKTPIIIISAVALALIILGILFIPKLFNPSEQLEKSIAVLPFRNDSPDQSNSAFVNGLMEKILNNLQLIKDFRVISRTSVEQYRNINKSAPEIAKELGVNYIVEGSAQKYGNAFSLSVQLIKADKKEDHLWGKSFEQKIKEVDDILKIQTEIAEAIAKELEANITTEEERLIEKISTRNLTALDFYQTGREEYWKYQTDPHNLTALDKAEDLYKRAVQYDPEFAQAYVGLAEVYWNKNYVAEYLLENFMDSALVLANTALSYDNDIPEAYILRGAYYMERGYDELALEEYDKAININPNSWIAFYYKAYMYSNNDMLNHIDNMHKALSINRGRELPNLYGFLASAYQNAGFHEIAKKYFQEKLIFDNDSAAYFLSLGHTGFDQGNLGNAIKYFKRAYLLDSTNIEILYQLGVNYGFIGQYDKALEFCIKWLEQLDKTLVASYRYNGMHRVGFVYWKAKRFDEADHYFNLQMEYNNKQISSNLPSAQKYYSYYDRAAVCAFRGEREKAFADLRIFNKKTKIPAWLVTLIKVDPLFDSLRNEPEFQKIVRDIEAKYQAEHERVRKWLEENNML